MLESHKQIMLVEVLFLFLLSTLLAFTNQWVFFFFIAILLFLNTYIICGFITINPITLSIVYILLSPFRRFISIHQPFYFPTALPLEIILFLLIIFSLRHFNKIHLLDNVIFLFLCYYIWGFIEIFNPMGSISIGTLGFRNRTMSSFFFLISFLFVKNDNDGNKLFDAIVIVLTIVGLYGIFHFFFPTSAEMSVYQQNLHQSNYFMSANSDMRRAFSTLTSPGAFGVSMFLLFSMLVYKASELTSQNKVKYFILLTISMIALLVSGSRSSLIAAILFLYLYFIFKGKLKDKIKFSIICFLSSVTIMFLLFTFGASDISSRIMGIFEPLEKGASFATRLGLWDILYDSITKMPFGFGNGATGIEIGLDNDSVQLPDVITILTDNEYVTLLYEQGWVGCFLFLAMTTSLIYKMYFCLPVVENIKSNYFKFIIVLSVVYLILGIPIQLSQIFPINIFMWILWGSSYAILKQEVQRQI